MQTENVPDNSRTTADLARLRRLATLMDNAHRLPVLGVRVGWDAILGLVPVVGDALALAPSAYIIKEAHRMGVPATGLARMGVNSAIDFAIGSIPLVGDIFDIGWKSKTRNVNLLEAHLAKAQDNTKKAASLRPFPE